MENIYAPEARSESDCEAIPDNIFRPDNTTARAVADANSAALSISLDESFDMCEHEDLESVLFSQNRLHSRIQEMGEQITEDLANQRLTIVIISNGAIIFGADLVRQISIPLQLDTISVSSYIGTESTGQPAIHFKLKVDLCDRSVLVVDDIFDSGCTLEAVVGRLQEFNPRQVKTCVLLDKKRARTTTLKPDYVGFGIDDHFVVGYGLDYNESYRHLPYIGILHPKIYQVNSGG